ncbi:unnamed protein product [Urochloa humidicola]
MPRRRRPTVPNPSKRATVNAVPFSPRSTSPPPPTAPPPPTPEHLHAVLAAAFDPSCLIPSSSSGVPDFELPRQNLNAVDKLKVGTVAPRSLWRAPSEKAKEKKAVDPPRQVFPRSVDIHVVSTRGKAPVCTPTPGGSSTPSPGRRSPPRAESPPSAAPAQPVRRDAAVPAPSDAGGSTNNSDDWNFGDPSELLSDEEEVESGDLSSDEQGTGPDGVTSADGSDLADWEGRTQSLEVWLPRGRRDVAGRLAFAYVHPPEVSASVALFIRSAITSVAPLVPVELLPSSRGAMILRFTCFADREYIRLRSPILFNGGELKLERPEETSNRFFRQPEWLAYVTVVDYPPEHWEEIEHIKSSFRGFCNVVEIDPACLTGYDYSPLRLVIEVTHRLEIPSEVWVDADDNVLGGSIVQIMPIRVWPRANQVGPDGELIPFFPPAPQQNQPPQAPLGLAGAPLPPPPPAHPAQQPPPTYLANTPNHAYLLHLAALFACTKLPVLPAPGAPAAVTAEFHTPNPLVDAPAPPPDQPNAADDAAIDVPPPAPFAQKRQSSRLAAMNGGKYVHTKDKAMQRKALQNSLMSCSSKLKAVVDKRNILHRDKLPLSATDLRKMVSAAGLGPDAANAIGGVPAGQK